MRRIVMRVFSMLFCVAMVFALLPSGMLSAYAADATYSVTYEGNGAPTGSVPSDSNVYAPGDRVTVLGNSGGLTRPGFYFGGWLAGDSLYQSGDTFITGTGNAKLSAAWIPVFKVTYDSNGDGWMTGGTPPVDAKQYPQGALVTVLSDNGSLYTYGYGFQWNTKRDGSGANYAPGSTFSMGTENVTLYAIYKERLDILLQTCGIDYNANGATSGEVPASATGDPGSFRVSDNTGSLLKTGYQFAGWNTAANGTGTRYHEGDILIVDSMKTLYALWKPICTLTYALNGGADSCPAGSDIQLRECMIDAPDANSQFLCWNTQAGGGGAAYMPGDVITILTDLTLFPIWRTKDSKCGVIYNGNGNDGGALPAVSYHAAGSTVTVAAQGTLTRSRYNFLGWSDSDGLLYRQSDTFTMPSDDLMLYARWKPNCTLNYDVLDTNMPVPASTTHAVGESVILPGTIGQSALTGSGSTAYFIGWSTQSDGSGTRYVPSGTFEITEDTTLYAVYTSDPPIVSFGSCTVTYSNFGAQSGQAPTDSKTYNEGDAATILDGGSLAYSGSNFVGWQRGDGSGATYVSGNKFTFPKGLTSLVLFPKFEAQPVSGRGYDLNYSNWYSEAGTAPAGQEGELVTVQGNPGQMVRAGYYFLFWRTGNDGTGIPYPPGSSISLDTEAIFWLYPYWMPGILRHNVFYCEYNSTTITDFVAEAATVTVKNPLSALSNGRYFGGWNTQNDGLGSWYMPGDRFTMLTSNVTLTAIYYGRPSYFVTYDGRGVSGKCNNVGKSYGAGDTVTTVYPGNLAGPAGTYFAGWNTKADGSGTQYRPGDTFTMGNSSLQLYGIWTAYNDRYTVTYDGNGAESGTPPVQSGVFYAGQTVTLSRGYSFQKSGYSLTGWYVNGVLYQTGATYTIPNQNVIARAAWERLSYPATVTATYSGNGNTGGAVPTSSSHALNSSFTLPDNTGGLTRTGCEFAGWNDGIKTYLPGGSYTFGSRLGSIDFNAVWQPMYSVSYSSGGPSSGKVPSDVAQYANGQPVTLLGNTSGLARANAIFAGWWVNEQIYYPGESFSMGSANETALAVWATQLSGDVTLRDLRVGGSTVAGFAANNYEYFVTLPLGTLSGSAAATVSAAAVDAGANVRITQADALPGDATVSVTSQNGLVNKTYTIHLVLAGSAAPTYEVTVTSGSGAGSYAQRATVTLSADPAPSGKRFKEWNITPTVTFLGSTGETNTAVQFAMPGKAVAATAVYEALPESVYAVNVQSDGNGIANVNVTSAVAGAEMTLTATPNSGFRFKKWQVISGGVNVADNIFTMPGNDVTVKAVFQSTAVIPTAVTAAAPTPSAVLLTFNGTVSATDGKDKIQDGITGTLTGGILSVSVSDEKAARMIDWAQNARQKGKKPTIVVEMEPQQGTTQADLTLSHATADEIAKSGASLTFKTGLGSITISSAGMANLAKKNSGGIVKLNMKTLDRSRLSSRAKQSVGSTLVYDFNITANGRKITSLMGGATVILPYVPSHGEKTVKIYYIESKGFLRSTIAKVAPNGSTFKLNSF